VSRKRLLIGAGAIAIVVVIAGVISWTWVRIYTGAAPPDQFYRPLSAPAAIPARQVLAVAHNAGNNAATTAGALRYGADVIEIDVIMARGRLVAELRPRLAVAGRARLSGPDACQGVAARGGGKDHQTRSPADGPRRVGFAGQIPE
jgi:hypothetical protein